MVVEREDRRKPSARPKRRDNGDAAIAAITDPADRAAWWPAIEEIFFLSAARPSFASDRERTAFFETWTGYYRAHEPRSIFLATATSGRLAGYLTGCLDSQAATRLYREIESYALFEDLFERYPAHLHVNCHPDFRGQGIGRRLVEAFLAQLRDMAVAGVHVVTAAGARNARFYRRAGFQDAASRPWQGRDLLFLGKVLAPLD